MNAMIKKAQYFMTQNLIDDLNNLKKQNVYIFSGTADLVTSTSKLIFQQKYLVNLIFKF